MAKRRDREDELPEFLYRLSPKEEGQLRKAMPKGLPDLGRLETALRPPFGWGASPWAWVILSLLFLPWLAIIPIALANNPPAGPDAEGERTAARIILVVSGVVGLGSLAFAGFLFCLPWPKRGEWWVFFEEGVVRLRWGRNPLVFPWKELKARKLLARPDGGKYEFAARDVKPVRIFVNRWLASRALTDTLLGRHILAVGPGVLRAIDAGESVRFGLFRVSQEGLSFKKEERSWDEIERVEATSAPEGKWQPRLAVYDGAREPWAEVDLSVDGWNAWLMLWVVRKRKKRVVKDFAALRAVIA
jgi:hypothetical protein